MLKRKCMLVDMIVDAVSTKKLTWTVCATINGRPENRPPTSHSFRRYHKNEASIKIGQHFNISITLINTFHVLIFFYVCCFRRHMTALNKVNIIGMNHFYWSYPYRDEFHFYWSYRCVSAGESPVNYIKYGGLHVQFVSLHIDKIHKKYN